MKIKSILATHCSLFSSNYTHNIAFYTLVIPPFCSFHNKNDEVTMISNIDGIVTN